MKNRKLLAMLAMTVVVSTVMTACSFGGGEPEQVVITPTPEPTKAPDPTPTPAPADGQTNIYTSKNMGVGIKIPDATWANKTDTEDMLSFESPQQGKLRVLHGQGDEDMSVAVIPTTPDIAVSLERAADLEQGTDFVIHNYESKDSNGIGIYTYIVEYLNEKSGYAYVVNRYIANNDEFFWLSASIKENDKELLSTAKKAITSFRIKGNSSLKSATQKNTTSTEGGNSEGNQGTPADTNVSDEALSDTNQTRTIYNNADGSALVVYADGNGGWADENGNTYDFMNDEDVYDQDGNDFYYHGEAADVYFMPVE